MPVSARTLFALTGVVGVLAGCRGYVSREPPLHPNLNMDFQTRFDAQEANGLEVDGKPLFADGRAMRPRVKGTIPKGGLKLDLHRDWGRRPDGTWATALPAGMVLDEALLTRGQGRFEIYCAPCHDARGSGAGTVVDRGMTPPPSFHQDRLRKFAVGQFYDAATNGVRSMAGYAAQIPTDDRWAIAAYIRALQLSSYTRFEDLPSEVVTQKGWTAPATPPNVLPPEPPATAPPLQGVAASAPSVSPAPPAPTAAGNASAAQATAPAGTPKEPQ